MKKKTSSAKQSQSQLKKKSTTKLVTKPVTKLPGKSAKKSVTQPKTKSVKSVKSVKSAKPVKTAKPVKAAKTAKTAKAVSQRAKPSLPFTISKSGIHGRGVFATRAIKKGRKLIEYTGELISWEEAERRYPVDPVPYHTFLFEIGDGSHCLDAQRRGSAAKWFNHSCKANCEVEEDDDERVWVRARRDIKVGDEMTYDYNLTCPDKVSVKDRKLRYPCWCGAKKCRQTMLGQS